MNNAKIKIQQKIIKRTHQTKQSKLLKNIALKEQSLKESKTENKNKQKHVLNNKHLFLKNNAKIKIQQKIIKQTHQKKQSKLYDKTFIIKNL